ncbi:MAG: hypothetical protein IPQ07_13600 [Myxococcales bacterium]|nr:hypothetical protein [Myxococcales bacterium]
MKLASALLATLVTGCMTSAPPAEDPGNPDGKADGGDAACTTSYVDWLLSTYKPALEAKPIDAARLTELGVLAQTMPCRGTALTGVAWTTWIDVNSYVAFAPYFTQHADAMVGYLMPSRPTHGDYGAYVAATAVREPTRNAVKAIELTRPIVSLERLEMSEWLDLYQVEAEEVLTRVFDPALIGNTEGYYTLNAGEQAFLDLVASTGPKPSQTRDGAYAAWIDLYGEVLQHGFSIDADDDYRSGLGCTAANPDVCARDKILDRVVKLAPPAHGDEDSTQWMWELSLWASLAATSTGPYQPTDEAQLARINAVRPAKVRGEGAYKVWLSIVADVATHADVMTGSVMPAKPCATGPAAAADYAAFKTANGALSASTIASAAPIACP